MGIRGLRSFITKKGILQPYQLQATRVVIDGNNICHQLLYEEPARHYGGNYEVIRQNALSFFHSLLQCGVTPYVIFDGAYDEDDKKLAHIISTSETRMDENEQNPSRNLECFPVLAYDIFIAVLEELKVPHIACEGESHNQIAVLARRWKCPVLSCDSDFYIFDLPGGFINFLDIPIKENIRGPINTKLYLIEHFESQLHFPKSFMPLAATILDKNYVNINDDIFKRFLRQVGASGHVKRANLDVTFAHLRRFKTPEKAVLLLKQCVDETSSVPDKLKRDIDASVRVYSSVLCFTNFDLAHYFEGKTAAVRRRNLPDSVMEKIRNGEISGLPIDITIGRVILKPTLEMYHLPPVQEITRPIRQILYGLVMKSSGLQLGNVVEVVRRQKKMEKKPISPIFEIEGIGSLPTLQEIENQDLNYKKNFLVAVFRSALQNAVQLPDSSLLYVYAMKYFLKSTSFQNSKLLPNLYSFSHIVLSHKGDITELRDVYNRVVRMDLEPDVGFFHNFLQLFHECLSMAYLMNALIGTPLHQPDPATVYDGKFMYNLFKTYNNESVIKGAILNVKNGEIWNLYERMVTVAFLSDA